ncbi:MAG: PAS domain S-box protein [Gammaproteobacteria bacterium]|nr:PAS domain S-box protein [Gammaproteobacteria bacterium]
MVVLFMCCLWLLQTSAIAAASVDRQAPLSVDELAWLDAHPVIRLAPDPDFPPIEFIDADGNYKGIAADYAALVERKLGVRFKIVRLSSWEDVLQKAQSREIDMFGAASKSPQRAEYMTFTQPHIELPGVILTRKDNDAELQPGDLRHRQVGVVAGYVWQDLLLNDYPDLPLYKVSDLKTGLQDLSFGKLDTLVANLATASWVIQREGITNLRVAGETGYFGRYAFATRNDWPELSRILEKALATVTPEQHQEILQRWVKVDAASSWLSRNMIITSAGILALLLLVLIWNRTLKSQVTQRTQALEDLLEQRHSAERALDQVNAELEQRVRERTVDLEQTNQRLRQEISERERIQDDLHRFQMTLNETLDCVFMFDDRDLRFIYVNQGAVDQVGYRQDELMQMTPFDIKPDFSETEFREFIQPFLDKREKVKTFETVHRHKNGSLIPVEVFLQYMAPENETPRFVAIVRDISERKRIEAAVSWSNRQIDIVSQAQSAFIANSDPRLAFDTLLAGLLELSGSQYGFIGEVLHADHKEPCLRTHSISNIARDRAALGVFEQDTPWGIEFASLEPLYGKAMKTGQVVIANDPQIEGRETTAPQERLPLRAFMAFPLYAGKDMVGLTGMANRAGGYDMGLVDSLKPLTSTCANLIVEYRRVQQRIRVEEQVRHNEERLRAVLDNILESIITIDRKGIVQSVNPSTEQIFGYTPDEIIGQNVKILMPEPHQSAHDKYIENYHHTRSAKIIGTGREVEGRHKDGSVFPMELSVTEVTTAGQALYVGVIRDITERKEQEAALLQARSELQRANEKLLEQARTDALTGIANRRFFDETLQREIRRAGREKRAPLSLILCDIDHFKLYNDTYGHIAGDQCLQQVATEIIGVFQRAGDLVARYGGEEFAVIMPSMDHANAAKMAERLRRAVWNRAITHASSLIADRVTLSIGTATIDSSGVAFSVQDFTNCADEALYAAKANGRNRVESFVSDSQLSTRMEAR